MGEKERCPSVYGAVGLRFVGSNPTLSTEKEVSDEFLDNGAGGAD